MAENQQVGLSRARLSILKRPEATAQIAAEVGGKGLALGIGDGQAGEAQ